MPSLLEPQLATLVDRPPAGDWSYEIKFDGYRMMSRVEKGSAQLFTRNGHDWTSRMPQLQQALADLPVDEVWLDGEAVVLDESGKPDFNALQNAFDRRRTTEIVLFIFDVLWLNGTDVREQPLRARRALLRELMAAVDSPLLRFSDDFPEDPSSLVASACKMKLEGIIGKRGDRPYRSGRSPDWIKLKCNARQEFVVGGISRRKGARAGVQSLLLGVFEKDGSLRYAGNVNPYFAARTGAAFSKRTESLIQKKTPFSNEPTVDKDREHVWLAPEIVAEVSFLEWTPGGEVRHPIFHAVREDKLATSVTQERTVHVNSDAPPAGITRPERERPGPQGTIIIDRVKVTNPQRVMDETTGLTKIEIARYYDAIAEWLLPHLHNRPLTLVRAPDGIKGELFFQKHADKLKIPGVEELPRELHPRHPPLLVANSARPRISRSRDFRSGP